MCLTRELQRMEPVCNSRTNQHTKPGDKQKSYNRWGEVGCWAGCCAGCVAGDCGRRWTGC